MNRFALLDSDNEDEKPKTASVTVDKKKKNETSAPSAASNQTTKATGGVVGAVVSAANAVANTVKGVFTTAPKAAASTSNEGQKKGGEGKGKGEQKPKSEQKPRSDKPKSDKPKSDKPKPKPVANGSADAPPATNATSGGGGGGAAGEVIGDSPAHKGLREKKSNQRGHNHQPKTRFDKRKDEADPQLKPDNRIRGAAHGINRRRPSKNPDMAEAESVAKEGEKNPNGVEVQVENVDAEEGGVEESVPEVPPEPEDKSLSLDEWNRRREEARASSSILSNEKTARVVEGLGNLKVKEDELSSGLIYTGTAKTAKSTKNNQRSTGKTVVLDLGFKSDSGPTFSNEDRPRTNNNNNNNNNHSGRNGGGNNRGPRTPNNNNNSGRNGGGNNRGPRVDLADQGAFPSL